MPDDEDKNSGGLGLTGFDPVGSGAAQVQAYGGAADIGAGGGPTGVGGFDLGLDRGPREGGGLSLQGTGLPGIGQPSSIGSKVGTAVGALASLFAGPAVGFAIKEAGKYGPGVVNQALGLVAPGPLGPGGMPAASEKFGGLLANSIGAVGSGAPGGLLGLGGDQSQADALAQLYVMLKAQGALA